MNNRNFFQKLRIPDVSRRNYAGYVHLMFSPEKRPVRERYFNSVLTRLRIDSASIPLKTCRESPKTGLQLPSAARAGLLLVELALVNWPSCQLVILRCGFFPQVVIEFF